MSGGDISGGGPRRTLAHHFGGTGRITILPGGEFRVAAWLIPAGDTFQVQSIAGKLLAVEQYPVRLELVDADGPVADALVIAEREAEFTPEDFREWLRGLNDSVKPGEQRQGVLL
ncbi:MAG: hypothetical protein IID51_14240 [Proteobacteria bacterium]|nr:hypothetical protein [Pseudomonadota bacterium]